MKMYLINAQYAVRSSELRIFFSNESVANQNNKLWLKETIIT